jgi:hypothetical protein
VIIIIDSQHVATVNSETRPGQNGVWWRGTCSCGLYRSRLYSEPERAGQAAAGHVRDKTKDEDPGPLRGLMRGVTFGNRSNVKWTIAGVTRIRYADDHGRLNIAGAPPFDTPDPEEPAHV